MNHSHWSIRSFIGRRQGAALLAAAALSLSTIPASAQTVGTDTFGCVTPPEDTIHLQVANPGPGDRVPFGTMVIHGVAYDRSSQSANSVDRVSLFLGTRGSGGMHLADATLGLPNPYAEPNSFLDTSAWAATVTLPPSSGGPSSLVVYAHSAVTDHESTVSVPFMLAQDSAPAQCTSSTTGGTGGPSAADTIHLELSNPNPNDSILVGNMVVQGLAFDTAAAPGEAPGVDRVTFFLDNRDEGGILIGQAVPVPDAAEMGMKHGFYQTEISVPNEAGGHTLWVYAHSSVTGHDTSINLPISVKNADAL